MPSCWDSRGPATIWCRTPAARMAGISSCGASIPEGAAGGSTTSRCLPQTPTTVWSCAQSAPMVSNSSGDPGGQPKQALIALFASQRRRLTLWDPAQCTSQYVSRRADSCSVRTASHVAAVPSIGQCSPARRSVCPLLKVVASRSRPWPVPPACCRRRRRSAQLCDRLAIANTERFSHPGQTYSISCHGATKVVNNGIALDLTPLFSHMGSHDAAAEAATRCVPFTPGGLCRSQASHFVYRTQPPHQPFHPRLTLARPDLLILACAGGLLTVHLTLQVQLRAVLLSYFTGMPSHVHRHTATGQALRDTICSLAFYNADSQRRTVRKAGLVTAERRSVRGSG